jgi:hypothetical protein
VNKLTLTLNRRAAASLVLVFALSFVNLVGAFLALTAFGGTGSWTRAQFVGLFGVLEAAMGISYLFAPNIWRLPVAEANTRSPVVVAPSPLLIPHWLAVAKILGGVVMIVYAAVSEGVGAETALLPVVVVSIAVGFLALCLAAARLGVARPDLDVFFLTVRRPRNKDWELPGLSVTGIAMQMLSNVGIFFLVAGLSPDSLFGDYMRPSTAVVLGSLAFAAALIAAAALAWWSRVSTRAPRAQEREAEAELAASP